MSNYATSRLTLTGRKPDLERFVCECIRVQRNDTTDLPSLDLEALVPMPLEIAATIGASSKEARQAALAATGYEHWEDWADEAWGTQWNAGAYSGRLINDMIYDCAFETPWSPPEAALQALAARYPKLSGTFLSSEEGSEWCLIGEIRDGVYAGTYADFDRQVDLLVRIAYGDRRLGNLSAHALIETFTAPRVGHARSDAESIPTLLSKILDALAGQAPGAVSRTLLFERRALDLAAQVTKGASARELRERALAQADQAAADVVCLLENDRMRTKLDRGVMLAVASCLRQEVIAAYDGLGTCSPCDRWVDELILWHTEENELRAWAAVALFRPGLLIDMGDADTLRQSVRDYARQLHMQLTTYLSDDRREQGMGAPPLDRAAA